ncbi:MAG: peptide-methionine (S)-S-oxide reductase MsrA [Bacteroidia bacterium]
MSNSQKDLNIQLELKNPNAEKDTIVLGAGCFWCIEAVFQRIEGVDSVESGYANGQIKNPSYREVCTGRTGHAEVAQLVYDPKVVSLAEILEIFWLTHDPTTLNRQGNDVGTQYRSGIYYRNEYQKKVAELSKKTADESGLWNNPIVTEIEAINSYYVAEDYHQNYFNENKNQPYCTFVVKPKVEKVHKLFKDKMKNYYLTE